MQDLFLIRRQDARYAISVFLLLFFSPFASPSISSAEQTEDARILNAAEIARNHMVALVEEEVRSLSKRTGIDKIDKRVLDAMRVVPRHDFVPIEIKAYAYNSHPLPIGHGQNIASPFLIALMTHLADLAPSDKVFETGTGAGYHAALLSRLVKDVYSVEVIPMLALSLIHI